MPNLDGNQEHSSTKTFPLMFPRPNVIKNTITFDASNGVNVRYMHRVLYTHPTCQVFLKILEPLEGILRECW